MLFSILASNLSNSFALPYEIEKARMSAPLHFEDKRVFVIRTALELASDENIEKFQKRTGVFLNK